MVRRGLFGPLGALSVIPWDLMVMDILDGSVSDPVSNPDYDLEPEP